MKKIKYKKIGENKFQEIHEDEIVAGEFMLEDITRTKDYHEQKYEEMKALEKQLKELDKE